MSVSHYWLSPSKCPKLDAAEVHLWSADVFQPSEVARAYEELLSPDELSRAWRFRFARDRMHYVMRRAMLRQLLGSYLGVPGQELAFRYGPWGKPVLADQGQERDIQFSLSHSAELVAYAITYAGRVGVDLEFIRCIPEADEIINRFFGSEDRRNYDLLSGHERKKAFFRLWTGREASLKAAGYGIASEYADHDTLDRPIPRDLMIDENDGKTQCSWVLRSFSPAPGYIGAVVVENNLFYLRQFHMPEGLR